MIRNRLTTSSWVSAADGSSMTMRRASWDSARAMLTTCLPAGDSRPTSVPGPISAWPRRDRRSLVARLTTPRRVKPNAERLVAEEDVLGDAQAVHQVELLVDRGDSGPHGRGRVGQAHRLAGQQHLPGIRLVGAGQHLDQRRLPRAVLAEQAMHLARAYIEIDAVEGAHAGELLDDAPHHQQRLRAAGGIGSSDAVGHGRPRIRPRNCAIQLSKAHRIGRPRVTLRFPPVPRRSSHARSRLSKGGDVPPRLTMIVLTVD